MLGKKTIFKYIVTSSKFGLLVIDSHQHTVLVKHRTLKGSHAFFFNAEFLLNSMGKDRLLKVGRILAIII